jgi:hypothetical protein
LYKVIAPIFKKLRLWPIKHFLGSSSQSYIP